MGDEEDTDLDVHICAHGSCNCLIRDSANEYCSPYCKGARGATGIACQCGHPECEENIPA
jgi:hypothetical protein